MTGFSKLFANTEYRKAWTTKNQILLAKQAQNGTPEDDPEAP